MDTTTVDIIIRLPAVTGALDNLVSHAVMSNCENICTRENSTQRMNFLIIDYEAGGFELGEAALVSREYAFISMVGGR